MSISLTAVIGDTLWKHEDGETRKVGVVTGVGLNEHDVITQAYIGDAVYDLYQENIAIQPPTTPEQVEAAIGDHTDIIAVRNHGCTLCLFRLNVGFIELRIETTELATLSFSTQHCEWYEGKPVLVESYTSTGAANEEVELGIDIHDDEVVRRYQ
jgi:hypothetical protein